MPHKECESAFYDYESWQTLREESALKNYDEWAQIYRYFEKYHAEHNDTCERVVIDSKCSEFDMFTDQCLITIIYDPCYMHDFVCDYNIISVTNEYYPTENCTQQLRNYTFWSQLRNEETF